MSISSKAGFVLCLEKFHRTPAQMLYAESLSKCHSELGPVAKTTGQGELGYGYGYIKHESVDVIAIDLKPRIVNSE